VGVLARAVFRTVLFDVINRFLNDFNIVFEVAESKVAVGAEQTSDPASSMAMIHIQRCYFTATSASSSLLFKHLLKVLLGNPVESFQVSLMSFVRIVLVVLSFLGCQAHFTLGTLFILTRRGKLFKGLLAETGGADFEHSKKPS
jgi:hypothetical protein